MGINKRINELEKQLNELNATTAPAGDLPRGGGECALNRPEFSRKHCDQFEPLAY